MFDLQTLQSFSGFYITFNSEGYLVLVIIAFILRFLFKKQEFAKNIISIGGIFLATSILFYFCLQWIQMLKLWYAGESFEVLIIIYREVGPFIWVYFGMILLVFIPTQFLWKKQFRKNIWFAFAIGFMTVFYLPLSALVNILVLKMNQGEFVTSKSSWDMQRPFWTLNGIFELVLKFAAYLVIIFMINLFISRKKVSNLNNSKINTDE